MAILILLQGSMIGIVMLVAPVFWFIVKAWVFDSFLELGNSGDTLLTYVLGYIWNASQILRVSFIAVVLAGALGGLAWIGTEDLRKEASEPTFSESVSETASSVADATKEKASAVADATKTTTKGWIARAKGWFGNDESDVGEDE